ncbi:MAG TPA: glycosyltransferase family 87 protein [Dongiaceae bacterium]|nr:glycosyltransferase family 87 protein [Dongiaceae bacterium]
MTADVRPTAPLADSPVKLFLVAAAVVAAILVALEDWRLLFAHGRDQPLGRDFLIFWLASSDIWHGDLAKVFDPWQFSKALHDILGGPLGFTPFPYPPLAVWFIAPLAALPYAVAWPTWLIVTFAAFAATLRRFFATRAQWLLILLTAPASLVNIADGQNGFLSAALLGGGLLALERRPILAGVLIGLLTFKPQLGLLLPFVLLAGGYYRVFVTAAATTLLLFAGSLAWLGWEPWSLYFEIGVPMQRLLLETGLGPFMVMVPSFLMSARILDLPVWLGYAVQAAVALVALVTCCWAIRRKAPLERRIAVIMAGALVAPPYCFNYDLPVLVAAQVLAWPGYRALDASERIVSALAWLSPVLMVVAGIAHMPVAPIVLLAQFFVLLRWLAAPAAAAVSAGARSAAA